MGRPYDANTEAKLLKLRRDNYDADDAWILTDGHRVSIAAQKVGENPTQKISLDRATFNKLIAWYMRDQKPATK